MLRIHRLCAIFGALFLIYVVFTGLATQLADMRALVTHAPASDPDMQMMRQHITGFNNYAVVSVPDYTATALPANLDKAAALAKTAALGRAALPGQDDIRLVELRMVNGALAGHVQIGKKHLIFDLATGARMPDSDLPPGVPMGIPGSVRDFFKVLHQNRSIPRFGTALNALVALTLFTLLLTGLTQYFRLLKSRKTIGRNAMLWRSGGLWRDLHRWVATIAGIFVLYIIVTGFVLSMDDLIASVRVMTAAPGSPPAIGRKIDPSAPIHEADFPAWTQTALAAFQAQEPDTAIRVLRLRSYGGYAQGVIVADDPDTTQLVFDAKTGRKLTMQEPGYPDLGYLSWEWHERIKLWHRGDEFGMPGRWFVTLGGLAMAYLIVSGLVMYTQLWRKRAATGRTALLWR